MGCCRGGKEFVVGTVEVGLVIGFKAFVMVVECIGVGEGTCF